MALIATDYYDYSRVMSYNAVYNFIVGGRGIGKTYGAVKRSINKSIKRRTEFIYLRRYREELATAKASFFIEMKQEFPDYEFRVNGKHGEYRKDEGEDNKAPWTRLCYFFALSQAQNIKSSAYPLVTDIIFDEFILEKSMTRYLPNEATIFNNFYSTVDRYKDKTKVLFLANSVSIMNPYFLEYEIIPDHEVPDEFSTYFDGFICVHYVDSEAFNTKALQSRFGRFIAGTEYADYAVKNTFRDNTDRLLGDKPSEARYLFSLKTDKGEFSVWFTFDTNEFHCQQRQPAKPLWHTTDPAKVSEQCILMDRTNKLLVQMRRAFKQGRMFFDKPVSRNALTDIFKQ